MFWTRPNTTIIITLKNSKLDNVPINVITSFMTHSQAPEQ